MTAARLPPRAWKSEPQSERMRCVLKAVKTLPLATSTTVAEHCGITIAQASYALNIWGRFKRIRHIGRDPSAGKSNSIIWGIA